MCAGSDIRVQESRTGEVVDHSGRHVSIVAQRRDEVKGLLRTKGGRKGERRRSNAAINSGGKMDSPEGVAFFLTELYKINILYN